MQVVILGGTVFIGRRVAETLAARGHDVTLVHRGATEPAGLAGFRHVHTDRGRFAVVAGRVRALRPDAVIECYAGRTCPMPSWWRCQVWTSTGPTSC